MLEYKVIPAILTDTLDDFEEQIEVVEQSVDLVQIDYVDGYFAPELTCCEARLIREVDVVTHLEVHLMVVDPIAQVKDWCKAGMSRLIGHIEEMEDQEEFVEEVSKYGCEVGLALNEETPLSDIEDHLIPSLDVVLLMGHEVGVQRATFNTKVLEKIALLRTKYPNLNIEVDGGVNEETIREIKDAGANLFAIGSQIFESSDPVAEYQKLMKLITT